jgi:hypothetical protein
VTNLAFRLALGDSTVATMAIPIAAINLVLYFLAGRIFMKKTKGNIRNALSIMSINIVLISATFLLVATSGHISELFLWIAFPAILPGVIFYGFFDRSIKIISVVIVGVYKWVWLAYNFSIMKREEGNKSLFVCGQEPLFGGWGSFFFRSLRFSMNVPILFPRIEPTTESKRLPSRYIRPITFHLLVTGFQKR